MNAYERGILTVQPSTFAQAADNIAALEALYSRENLSIASTSSLGTLIKEGRRVVRGLAAVDTAGITTLKVVRAHHLDRIACAALPLTKEPRAREHLWALKKGSLDPSSRDRSVAKDKLWELELWAALNSSGLSATLEEPDVVARTPAGEIAIACKRLYSPKNVESQMSAGVSQIAKSGRHGILALCIEDLVIPPNHWIKGANIYEASSALNNFNLRFLSKHREQLASYAAQGRVMAVLVCSAATVLLRDLGFRHCTQMQFWVHTGLASEELAHMEEFETVLMRGRNTDRPDHANERRERDIAHTPGAFNA